MKRACSSAGCMFQQLKEGKDRNHKPWLAHQLTRTPQPQQGGSACARSMEKQGSGVVACATTRNQLDGVSVTAGSTRAHVSAGTGKAQGHTPYVLQASCSHTGRTAQPAACQQKGGKPLLGHDITATHRATLVTTHHRQHSLQGRGPAEKCHLAHACLCLPPTQASHSLWQATWHSTPIHSAQLPMLPAEAATGS